MLKLTLIFATVLAIAFASTTVVVAAPAERNPATDPLLIEVQESGSQQDAIEAGSVESEICEAGVTIVGRDCPNADDGRGGLIGFWNRVLGGVIYVVTAIAVVIIIISGLRLATSGGDPQSIQQSRNAIIYALVALVVVILARSIVSFVLSRI